MGDVLQLEWLPQQPFKSFSVTLLLLRVTGGLLLDDSLTHAAQRTILKGQQRLCCTCGCCCISGCALAAAAHSEMLSAVHGHSALCSCHIAWVMHECCALLSALHCHISQSASHAAALGPIVLVCMSCVHGNRLINGISAASWP